jgi:hypothetical protein
MVILQSVVVECFHCNMSWIYFHDSVDRVVVLLVGANKPIETTSSFLSPNSQVSS